MAHGAVITLGAYSTYLFLQQLQFPLVVSIILSILVCVILGWSSNFLIYRKMREKNLPVFSYLVCSLGLYIAIQNLISLYFGDDAKTVYLETVSKSIQIFDSYITELQTIIILTSLILFITLFLFTQYTVLGKSIRAVSVNPDLAKIYGINEEKIISFCFIIGSSFAGVAGIIYGMDISFTPHFGFSLLLYGIIAMILGGVGSYKGLIYGSILVSTAQHLSSFYFDTKWMDIAAFILLILFLMWKPLGFSGSRLKKIEI